MPLPILEYSRIDPWTMTSGPGSVSIAMAGPTGTKRTIILFITGKGVPGGVTLSQFTNVRFTSSAFSPITCTFVGRRRAITPGDEFFEIFYARDVPIGSGASTTYFEFTWSGTCSGLCPFGGVEFFYWNLLSGPLLVRSQQGVGLTAVEEFLPIATNATYFCVILGTVATAISDWHLAGSSGMQTLYPAHATDPPQFTNNQSVVVGAAPQTGAPKICCGYMSGPTGSNVFYGFSFATSTEWQMYIMTISGSTPPVVAVPAQLATIIG